MAEKPKALLLADEVAAMQPAYFTREVAAELRRLHDLLGKANALCRIRAAEIERLKAEKSELLEALKFALENGCQTVYANGDDGIGGKGCCDELSYHPHSPDCWTIKARAAIAKAEGEKG